MSHIVRPAKTFRPQELSKRLWLWFSQFGAGSDFYRSEKGTTFRLPGVAPPFLKRACAENSLRQAGNAYHVINRGNGRAEVFHKTQDHEAFLLLWSEDVATPDSPPHP